MYIDDIFFDLDHLSLDDKKNLLRDAKRLSYYWHVDILDGNCIARRTVKFARLESVLKRTDESTYFIFIKRGGFVDKKRFSRKWNWNSFCIETGFRTMTSPDYFLFINVDLKHLDFFTEKYRLDKIL